MMKETIQEPRRLDELALSILSNRNSSPFIELKGYSYKNHIKENEEEKYKEAKKPTGSTWTYISQSEAKNWTKEHDGWFGLPVSEGNILIDIDDKVLFQRIHKNLIQMGAKFISIETPHGGQFVFKDTHKVKTQTAKTITVGGFLCDYRLADKGYFVWPSMNIKKRQFLHIDEELDFMPLIFIPVKKSKTEDQDKLFSDTIPEGSRDDTLFRHACRLREWNGKYDLNLTDQELTKILEEVNSIFCEPPLHYQEIWQKIKSACRYEGKIPGYDSIRICKSIRVIGISEFLSLELPPRENILTPWLPTQGLVMVYGPRGIGKTHFVMGCAVAVASGGKFLKWTASKPLGVLYLDGEMPAVVVQERYSNIIASSEKEPIAALNIVTPDLQEWGLPDLSTFQGQETLNPYLDGISLVIVDNISTLCRMGRENESESWSPVQEYALRLRSKHISVLFVHHSGKGGFQRGTSRREDVLDTVISLKRPADYMPDEGARFEVHFEKARNIHGDDVKPFEAKLMTIKGIQQWNFKDLEESLTERIANLLNESVPQNEIAELLGVSKGTVSKHKHKAQSQGLLGNKK
jgi:DNA-binding CsgD family transcriptional regulator